MSLLALSKGRTDSFFFLHELGHPILDNLFVAFSFIGDGWMGIPIALILLFASTYRGLLAFALSLGLSALITQTLKRTVFSEIKRPLGEFGRDALILVEDFRLHENFSFPSGHTTAGFALFFGMAILLKRFPIWQVFCGLCACLIGYSRVYLGQHFPQDLAAGATIACLVTIIIFTWTDSFKSPKWNKSILG